jgi:hypothetical protein
LSRCVNCLKNRARNGFKPCSVSSGAQVLKSLLTHFPL